MKTTVDLADALLNETKLIAATEGTTMRALIEEVLREVIARRRSRQPFTLRDASVGGNGLQAGVEPGWAQLRDLVYEGRGT